MREGWDPCLAVIINEKRKKKTRTIFHMISKNTIPLRIKRGSISSHRPKFLMNLHGYLLLKIASQPIIKIPKAENTTPTYNALTI